VGTLAPFLILLLTEIYVIIRFMNTIRRPTYKIQDLSYNEYDLLKEAYFLHQNQIENQPVSFVCFGASYYKLLDLDLIDDENQITFHGRQLVKYLAARL